MFRFVNLALLLLMAGLLPLQSAQAGNRALEELMRALLDNGTIDRQTYELVLRVAEQEEKQSANVSGSADVNESIRQVVVEEVEKSTADQPRITTNGKFEVESPEGDFSFRVGGRIQVDAATYNEDRLRHNDGTEFRRVRLFASGKLWRAWAYKLQYDFTATGVNGIQDAFIDYKGFKRWSIRAGHFKEPFSLQNMTSSKYIRFMERGMPHLFVPGRNIGLSVTTSGSNWSFSSGVFGEGRDGSGGDNDEGYGMSARATYAPMFGRDRFVHLGGSASHRQTGSRDTVRFRDRPESHLTDVRLVDTGQIDTDSFSRLAGEAALVLGPFALEGEYYYLDLDREISGNPDLAFSGFYLQGSWFLTGETLNYNASKGSFGKLSPHSIVGKGGLGAWQLAMRFSSIDLTDEDINGGEQQAMTLGLNWFPAPNLRFIANYVNILDVDGGPASGDEPDSFQVRAQVEF